MSDLADFSAVDLVEAYRLKRLSPVEVTDAVIARIDASEPKLNALWAYNPGAAREAARASEARWGKGEPLGAIDGVPVTIKENIATKGTAVPLGCAAVTLTPATADAPPAARTREAGGVILAKTTMPDYGMLSSGLSSFHKLARNPWDLSANPGGSSAGAGGGRRRRLRPAAYRHGHWRFGPSAGRLVRRRRPEAVGRPCPDQSALHRTGRRADDPHGRRHGTLHVRSVEAGCARHHVLAQCRHFLARP